MASVYACVAVCNDAVVINLITVFSSPWEMLCVCGRTLSVCESGSTAPPVSGVTVDLSMSRPLSSLGFGVVTQARC